MDSFDIMSQFDSMLPPGDVYRKTFDTALMGLESKKGGGGGGGGGSDGPDWDEVADLTHEQAMNNYEYDWDQTQRRYTHQILQNENQRRDMANQHAYQTAQHEQQWMYANALQEQEYNSQMAAYNKSERLYEHQVDMNQIAADMAIEAQRAQTSERFQQLAFEATKAISTFGKDRTDLAVQDATADLKFAGQKADLALQGQTVDLDIYGKRTAASRKKQELTIGEQTKRGITALQSVEDAVKGMQALGKAKARGQAGRSAEKQYQSLLAQQSRLQAAKAYQLNRTDLATRLAVNGVDQTMREQEVGAAIAHTKIGVAGIQAEAGYDLSKEGIKAATTHVNEMFDIGVDERDATSLSIEGAHNRSLRKIDHDQYAANVAADFNRMSKPGMGVPIPKPLEIPMATIMDPLLPVKGKEPVWGANMGAASSAGSSGGGGPTAGGALGGAANGFMMGAATGMPHMAGIGAVVGFFTGLFG